MCLRRGYTVPTMDARTTKGMALAKDKRIKRVSDDVWFVPSQSGAAGYAVNLQAASCTCPDHELRRSRCKHQIAVELTRTVVTNDAGESLITETVKVTRRTYKQNWPSYNAGQCAEKEDVQALLKTLCLEIPTTPHPGRGPKPIPLSDAVFAMVMKVYTTVSGRRATTDMKACAAAGHMQKAPHYNSVFNYFEKPEVTPVLVGLVEQSAQPLAAIETRFAVDSTGFGTSVYRRWFDQKYGHEVKEATWLKCHAVVGVRSNIVTAVRVTEGNVGDCPELPALVEATAARFKIAEVSADKAYLSVANLEAIEAAGAVPLIPFKKNSQPIGPAAWRRMWGLFVYRQEEFLARYHQRSNVESAFSAIKRKFGGSVRSKCPVAQVNEILAKVLCHNLATVAQATRELGVTGSFTEQSA